MVYIFRTSISGLYPHVSVWHYTAFWEVKILFALSNSLLTYMITSLVLAKSEYIKELSDKDSNRFEPVQLLTASKGQSIPNNKTILLQINKTNILVLQIKLL